MPDLKDQILDKVRSFLDNADKLNLPAKLEINYANKQAKIEAAVYETIKAE